MISLLSRDYHKKQQPSRPNVVQALLEGLQLSHPQPRMPSELIKYIRKTYNAWHIALALLENIRCGLWKKRSVSAETKAGLSLVQHGYWQRAQSPFYQAMVKATHCTYNNTVPKAETCLWEEQWLSSSCASQLSLWDALVEFGKSIENYEILLDSLLKLSDWTYMKDHVIPKAQVEETPKLRLIQAFVALHDKNTNGVGDAENIVGKGVDLSLEQWWQLPEISVHARVPLLQQFQQLVEVQESARILVDIANGSKLSGNSVAGVHGNLYADLKDILETWRLRTPNKWDNMSIWHDLLQWRNEMYIAVIDVFKEFSTTNPQLHHLGFRDKAWNVNKLARIARKQGHYDVCVSILEKMYGHSTMEVQEAFVKITEQAKAYLEMKGELTSVLNLINSRNAIIKHLYFVREYKQDFEDDLDPDSTSTFPTTLSELTERLKHWKNILQSNVEDRFPAALKLEEESKASSCTHPIIIPVWSQVRMVEDDLMYNTFLEVYENHCAGHDREADLPITYFKEQLNQAISGQISPEAVVDLRLQASPNKILFAKNTGKIFQTDFHPAYVNGVIEFSELVPFRLTSNMQAFFSHFGVEGLILSSMCAAAQAVVSPKQTQHLWYQLAMFFRNELFSWSWRRPLGMPLSASSGGGNLNLADFKHKVTTNVEKVINRISGIAPQCLSEEEENVMDPPRSTQRGVTELVDAADKIVHDGSNMASMFLN
ncbi:hypothetical protein F3Y22_tig00117012pilonHSYRG00107 [Hibiscus syriacus]|uniref:PIK-related kinase FAT domain-containing protein n=1 Tax=Hibiscus syriacus TaxID=106335 RepID=A0A6A2WCM9_HIBSY|nr:hypothetical protein F3Y22_tig00117012pilonHSYRG00107 [Hibiscus syriacus]